MQSNITFREQFNNLEKEIERVYFKLISNIDTSLYIKNHDEVSSISILDEVNGGRFEVFIQAFNPDGSFLGRAVFDTTIDNFTFDQLLISDQIDLLSLLRELVMEEINNKIQNHHDSN